MLYSQGCRCVECCTAELASVDLMLDEEAARAATTTLADAGTKARGARNLRAARTVRYVMVRTELADAKRRTRTAEKSHPVRSTPNAFSSGSESRSIKTISRRRISSISP